MEGEGKGWKPSVREIPTLVHRETKKEGTLNRGSVQIKEKRDRETKKKRKRGKR